MSRSRPTPATVAIATGGGLANVGAVLALYARAEYPALESAPETGVLALTAFALGFLSLFVSAHTRLLAPASGWLAVLAGTIALELATPTPEWSEWWTGAVAVEGPTHVGSYANAWYVWLALVLVAGVVEFALRRGYGVGSRRLRNLPELPLSWSALARIVVGFAALVGIATTLLALRSGITPPAAALAVLVVATAVTAVPLAALLARGIVTPVVLFALLVPYVLTLEVFTTTDSPVHLFLFGPYAVVLAVAWALEAALRSRLRGWNGGRFVRRTAA